MTDSRHNPETVETDKFTSENNLTLIGERPPVDADYDAIFRAAADTGTALEINGSLERLDLKDSHIARARELGATLVINTDAHTTEGLANMEYGVSLARRGWCEPTDILNCLTADQFTARLGNRQ